MPMNYQPQDKVAGGGKVPPGKYEFRVMEAEEKVFKTGNEGVSVKIAVEVSESRDITNYANFAYTKGALWRLEQFMTAVGLDFAHPPAVHELIGLRGRVDLEDTGEKYLSVKEWLAPDAQWVARQKDQIAAESARRRQRTEPPPPDDRDAPPPIGDADLPF